MGNTRPLGGRLGYFFQEARRLIEVDVGVLQDVIQSFAREGGLRCICEMVEQRFESMPSPRKENVFKNQILPFFETLTHPNVLLSLVLEQSVGTIYNFLFGVGGARAAHLLEYVCDVLTNSGKSEQDVSWYEVSSLVFSRIVDLNSTASVQEPLKVQAKRFENIFITMNTNGLDKLLYNSRAHLERLLRRLEIGCSLPAASPARKNEGQKSALSFTIHHEPPGGRHNNDHADICQIRVMPSYQEIMSTRTEYLPVNDPTQWHVDGLDGLLDRNFRLLREDTVGQLRDAIHHEIRRAREQLPHQRMNIYRDARVVKVGFEWMSGLYFGIGFPQPRNLKEMSLGQRENWWQASKRLQPGAVVCLVFKKNIVLFCTVTEPQGRVPRKGEEGNRPRKDDKLESGSLWKAKNTASVMLQLVDSRGNNVQSILSHYTSKTLGFTLVEFPGVLLPAFEPTLRALQLMKKNGALPFPDLLVPSSSDATGLVKIPPPNYAVKPGFAFNLRCLMRNDADLYVRHDQPVDIRRLQDNSSLDDAQAEALVTSLQRKVGLIQGPPGTGKSYTGVALIKVLLANKVHGKAKLGPIICVTYTNHALDQLLEALLDKGVTSQIVRIGSRSQSDKLEPFKLRTVAKNVDKTKMEKSAQWNIHRQLEGFVEEFNSTGLKGDISRSRLLPYLWKNHLHHYRQLFGTDEDGYKTVQSNDPHKTIKAWLGNGNARNEDIRSIDELKDINLFSMSRAERQALHQHWVDEINRFVQDKLIRLVSSHSTAKSEFDNIRDEVDLRCLNQAHVIGLTTTGLARNLKMLQRLQSKVVVCEEAGEVLEGHLLTALLPSIEHAILIGDHLQLRPQVQNYDLSRENRRGGEQYSLDVSLFERLVESKNPMGSGLPFSTLETQRRMHPSIAQLVRDTLYPQLSDDPSVSEYPAVVGMRKRLFWLDHRIPEGDSSNNDATTTSHWNQYEIDMTTALVNHLVQQGQYQTGDIAVLTPYLGQLHRLRQRLSRSFAITLGERDKDDLEKAGFDEVDQGNSHIRATLLQTLRVATIDNFQGEEAKVVVISLVRSNPENKCGFLRTSNRINVLLSRAQHGMYIIGNSQTSIHVPMWESVIDILRQNENIGDTLELQCPRHRDTPIAVSDPDDFPRVSPEGGCDLRCINRLKCGHACAQKCHSEILHNAVYCLEECPRPRKGCAHPCPKKCGDPCPLKCHVNIFNKDRLLGCGHLVQNLPCWQDQDLSTVRCTVFVQKDVPHCHHKVSVQCCVDVASSKYDCKAQCRTILPCGHTCKNLCMDCVTKTESGEIRVNHGSCKQKCGRNQSTCAHVCNTPCHGQEPCPPCQAPCDVECGHSKCMKQCCDPCTPCAEEKCLSACPHSACSMPCAAPCDHVPCSRRCQKTLECGHQCPSVCGEKCPSQAYCQTCGNDDIKNHLVDFILGETYNEVDLNQTPCIFPRCGHFLTVESMDGQMDLKKHYDVDVDGVPVSITTASVPFSMEDIKTCASCRGPLRDIARYGRLIRRAVLDESTKKLILYLNREYVPLAQEVPRHIQQLQEAKNEKRLDWPAKTTIARSRDEQMAAMKDIMNRVSPGSWKAIIDLRKRILKYCSRVKPEEQPFNRVRDMVENARRRNKTTSNFEFDNNVLQTKGILQATALSIRLDIALLADFLALRQDTDPKKANNSIEINLDKNREECELLIQTADSSRRLLQQTEGFIFLAQLHALERSQCPSPEIAEIHLEKCHAAIAEARSLCSTYPGQTTGLPDEIDGVEKMLAGSTFYTAVTNEERMAVIQAMAREFRGTGHWYYCGNGHPFTIGECGGAVQRASCPECGAPVGGAHHVTAEGVTRASEFEDSFARLAL
ncbi:hypothetical protein AWENTII_011814 [Aspergillus wentii]